MNLLKKIKFEHIIICYIMLSPIIDALTSLCVRYIELPLTFGMVIRTAFLVFVVAYSFFIMDKREIICSVVYYFIVLAYLVCFLYLSYSKYEMNGILIQIKGCLKAFSFPTVLWALIAIFKKQKTNIPNKYFVASLIGYCVLIILPFLFGIDFPTYDIGKNEGTVGLFYAGNEIGAILCILSCYLVIEIFNSNKRNLWLDIIVTIIAIFCTMYLGTKAPFIGNVALVLVSLIMAILIAIFKNKKYSYRVIGSLVALALIGVSVGYTPVGKNTYIEPFSISFFSGSNGKIDKEREERKAQDTGDMLSGREAFLVKNLSEYKNSSIKEKLLGISYASVNDGTIGTRKLVEMDYYDIFLCHGLIGTLIYSIPILLVLGEIFIKAIKRIKTVILNKDVMIMGYAIVVSIGIAYLAGHTFTSSAVSILFALTLIKELGLITDIDVNNDLEDYNRRKI